MTAPKQTPCIELGTHVSDHENCTSTLIDFSGVPFEIATNRAKVKPEYHSQMVRDVIHAVNLHDDLVKALKALAAIRLGDLGSDALESFQSTGDVFDFTADVLHRAKEGQ